MAVSRLSLSPLAVIKEYLVIPILSDLIREWSRQDGGLTANEVSALEQAVRNDPVRAKELIIEILQSADDKKTYAFELALRATKKDRIVEIMNTARELEKIKDFPADQSAHCTVLKKMLPVLKQKLDTAMIAQMLNQLSREVQTVDVNHYQLLLMSKQVDQAIEQFVIKVLCEKDEVVFTLFMDVVKNSHLDDLYLSLVMQHEEIKLALSLEITLSIEPLCDVASDQRPIIDLLRSRLVDPKKDLRRKLVQTYDLSNIEVVKETRNAIHVYFKSKKQGLRKQIMEDLMNIHLQKLIKQYSFIEVASAEWKVFVSPILSFPNVSDSAGPNLTSASAVPGGSPQTSLSPQQPLSIPYAQPHEVLKIGDQRLLDMALNDAKLAHLPVSDKLLDDCVLAQIITASQCVTIKAKPSNNRYKDLVTVIIVTVKSYSILIKFRECLMINDAGALAVMLPDEKDLSLLTFVIEKRAVSHEKTTVIRFLRSLIEFVAFWMDKGLDQSHIRPDNIRCSLQGDRVRVMEAVMKTSSAGEMSETTAQQYSAPEVALKNPKPASISWSVGCCVLFMITGEHPWDFLKSATKNLNKEIAGSPHKLLNRIDDLRKKGQITVNMENILKKLLAPNWRDRMPCTNTQVLEHKVFEELSEGFREFVDIGKRGDSGRSSSQEAQQKVQIMTKLLIDIIQKKDCTVYDFWVQLKKCRTSAILGNQLISEDGYNVLHMTVDKGRLSLLPAILHIGWWDMLFKQKVPETSRGDHRGKNALEIAEMKRTRKPQDEVQNCIKLEESLTALMKAARSGDLSKVKVLLDKDVHDRYLQDENGGNALYWAAVNGNKEIFVLLLEKGVEAASMRTKKGESLFHIIASVGSSQLVKPLVDYYKKNRFDLHLEWEDNNHKTALDRFAENGDIETMKAFIEAGVDVKQYENIPVLAAYSGRKALVEYAIGDFGMPVDSKDLYSRTPLLRAIEGGRENIVSYMLEKKPDLSHKTCSNRNVLHILAESGNVKLTEDIITKVQEANLLKQLIGEQDRYNGVDLCFLIRGRDHGRDAWHYVEVPRFRVPIFLKKTKSGNVDVAAYGVVIKSGWGVNPDTEGVAEIEEMFKQRRLDQQAPKDMTPLHLAIYKDNTDVAKKLLQHGASVSVKDRFGLTPLMIAAAKGNLDLVRGLEAKAAKFTDLSADGKTVSQIADENEHDQIVQYIAGRDYFSLAKNFVDANYESFKERLSQEELEKIRTEGSNVRDYLVDVLRDFTTEINKFLVDLKSGPVHQPSN